jgi:hypothetical protein
VSPVKVIECHVGKKTAGDVKRYSISLPTPNMLDDRPMADARNQPMAGPKHAASMRGRERRG